MCFYLIYKIYLIDLINIFVNVFTSLIIENLIELIFNHPNAYKLSQSLFNDLAYLKCSYNENCFQKCQLSHVIELSDVFRKAFPDEKEQQIYSLQRMTARTLHCQLDKKQQCANWSKRPLTQVIKRLCSYRDVIVMIDIYDRLKTKIESARKSIIYLVCEIDCTGE